MKPLRYLPAKRAMYAAIFLAMPLLAYGGGPPFKATLIPCDTWCGPFGATEGFVFPGEPATLTGLAGVSATGVLKVQVKGATPNQFYQVWVAQVFGPAAPLPNNLSTDASGDGTVNNTLPAGTYISGVFLTRDSNVPPNFIQDPRIATGFVIP
ncbi:MAG: hypothetical protein HY824_12605 [Acidobacteria bacterium]|nr:hypothetical protein [Acidobacteriota bacterium]